jgi:hypothetical protein
LIDQDSSLMWLLSNLQEILLIDIQLLFSFLMMSVLV